MNDFKQVIVVGGGIGDEREVSLRSSRAVFDSCQKLGISAKFIDAAEDRDFVSKLNPKSDIVLLIIHGEDGEDGVFQEQMEQKGIRFLGAGSVSSKICFHKNLTRQCLKKAGLKVAEGDYIRIEDYKDHSLSKKPHVLKSPEGGSSIGTLLVKNPNQPNHKAISDLFSKNEELVIEELIEGTEITVSVLGNNALPVIEIIPPENEEFDYDNKYNGKTLEICPPKSISEAVQKHAQQLAWKVHEATGCRHLSRTDFIINKNNEPIILEINTIPGLTDQSLFPKSALAAGHDFTKLTDEFVKMTAEG